MAKSEQLAAWAAAVGAACGVFHKAMEVALAKGGGDAWPEIGAATAMVNRVPALPAGWPEHYAAAAQRLAHAANALGNIEPPGQGDHQRRVAQFAEIGAVVHAADARAKAAQLVVLADKEGPVGPARPCLLAWAHQWEAIGFYQEAIGRRIAGLDPGAPAVELMAGLRAAVAALDTQIAAAKAALPAADPAGFAQTLTLDGQALAEWRRLLADPANMTLPPGRAALAAFDAIDRQRLELQRRRLGA